MSIEAIEETFAALTEDLNRGLVCDAHKEEEHRAWWFFETTCSSCHKESSYAACDAVYYKNILANKEKEVMECMGCGTVSKPFDLIQTTRKMN